MTLHLTLKKIWFDLMISGKKQIEYRRPSKWIEKRIINKNYDFIKFVNGYGNDKPYFICKYDGYTNSNKDNEVIIEGNPIKINKGDFLIKLGDVIETGNLKL